MLNRRRLLTAGAGGTVLLAGGIVGALELVDHGVLPGKTQLDNLDGACDVSHPPFRYRTLGDSRSGTFYSRFRRRQVGYTLAFPSGHTAGSDIPLVVMLHGEGGNHVHALQGMSPREAVSLELGSSTSSNSGSGGSSSVEAVATPPFALVTVDGGRGYWNPHPGDDPMSMVMYELIPRCQELGAGRGGAGIATMGISMGGYGAILLAEKFPQVIKAVAAISPAIWTSYAQARSVNAGAYASAADFAACDAVTHAGALAGIPVRVASGEDDPFHPGVKALAARLGSKATVEFSKGCHSGPFFESQEVPSLNFLARHLNSVP